MIQLNPKEYHLAGSSLENVGINHLFARAVVEHHSDGSVFCDNMDTPGAFYIVHSCGMSLLFGRINEKFLHAPLKDYLLGQNGIRQSDESLQIYPNELEARIDNMLGEKLLQQNGIDNQEQAVNVVFKDSRTNFKFNPLSFNKFLSGIDLSRYRFRELDADAYNQSNGSVVPKEFWKDVDAFLLNGKGFSLIHGKQPVAIAFSSFKHGSKLEIGIETSPNFRGLGFASIACARMIVYCLEKNLEPIWACRSSNLGSYYLALKLGFKPVEELPYYELPAIP